MSSLQLKVREKKSKVEGEKSQWEGTVSVDGLKPTKLTRKDGSTTFGTKASLMNAAKKVAASLGFSDGVSQEEPAVAKKAAKTKTTSKSAKKSKVSSTSASTT